MDASVSKENRIFFNCSFDKKRLKALISWVFKQSGEAEALRVIDLLKETGFRHATKAGISIGLHDLNTPIQKSWLISESQLAMNTTESDFVGARITATERSQRIIDTWHRASESLSKEVVDYFGIYDRFNPVYIMALSGARGNFSQVRQLIGMRGLMADQQGKIVNFPIRSNLREGLTLTEYFISCSGARKGLVDTALRTADTGYLTRRLVDVSHHVVVKRIRCNTNRGIAFKSLQSYNKVLLPLKERLVGRVLAEDVFSNDGFASLVVAEQDPCCNQHLSPTKAGFGKHGSPTKVVKVRNRVTKRLEDSIENLSRFSEAEPTALSCDLKRRHKKVGKRDQEISLKLALKIAKIRDKVFLRSPLTCGFTHTVCQLCYGWSISQGSLVSLGDAVGVIAAQSIGEPGTQLTMRTFHTGGVFSGDLLQEIRSPHAGEIEFSKAFQGLLIRTAHGRIAFLSKTQGSLVLRHAPSENKNSFTTVPIPAFTMLFVRQGERVENNQLLAEYSIRTKEGNQPIKTQQTIFAQLSGRVVEDRSGKVYTKPIKESRLLLHTLESKDLSFPASDGVACTVPVRGIKSKICQGIGALEKTALIPLQIKARPLTNLTTDTKGDGFASLTNRRFVTPYGESNRRFVTPYKESDLTPENHRFVTHLLGVSSGTPFCAGNFRAAGNSRFTLAKKAIFCYKAFFEGGGPHLYHLPQMKKWKMQPLGLHKPSLSQIRKLNVPHNVQNELLQKIFDTKLGRWNTTPTVKGKRFVFLNLAKKKQSSICKASLFSLYKSENLENDRFKDVEPVRSGRLGFLKILSTRVGATLDYISPIKPFDTLLKKREGLHGFECHPAESKDAPFNKKQESEQELVATLPFLSSLTARYLHPCSLKENRFFLQTIAEYGDVVEEGYSFSEG